jgi:hypothetical protein
MLLVVLTCTWTISVHLSAVASGHDNADATLTISEIKGFNYVPSNRINDVDTWRDYNETTVELEMAYASRVGFNFMRVFLNFVVWEAERENFIIKLQHLVQTANSHGISTMPVVFDGCQFGCDNEVPEYNSTTKCWLASPGHSRQNNVSWWPKGEKYVSALVHGLPDNTPGLMLWDVNNEPECAGAAQNWDFVQHFVLFFKNVTSTPVTVGVASAQDLGKVALYVNIISYHSYHHTWKDGLANLNLARSFADWYKKPFFNSETGCISRANSYDQTIELHQMYGVGWVIWELMISECQDCVDTRRWKHGIVYSDGSIRDAAAVAAVSGFFIKRQGEIAVPRPDVEGVSTQVVKLGKLWLSNISSNNYADGCNVLDSMANLLESSCTISFVIPLSYEVRSLIASGDTLENRQRLAELIQNAMTMLLIVSDGYETQPGTCVYT